MNFSLKPNTIISHFLPGAFFLLATASMLVFHFGHGICDVDKLNGPLVALLGGAGFPSALIIGLIFDAFRNWIWECICDPFDPMDWDIFVHGEAKFLENLMDSYYGFYVFDVNLMISIICTAIVATVLNFELEMPDKWLVFLVGTTIAVILILFFDAIDLRKEIKRLADEEVAKAEATDAEQATT